MDKLLVMVTPRILREVEREIPEMGGGRVAVSFLFLSTTRSSAHADNRLDAFSGQSRSTNKVPFHMLDIVSYCAM